MKLKVAVFFGVALLIPIHGAHAFFTLDVSPPSINLGILDPGGASSPEEAVSLTVNSNNGLVWTLSLSASPLTHNDGVTTFPSNNFRYRFTSDYPGAEVPASRTDASVPVSPTTIYTADSSEYNLTSGVYYLGFLAFAGAQKMGSYSSQITITLIDAF